MASKKLKQNTKKNLMKNKTMKTSNRKRGGTKLPIQNSVAASTKRCSKIIPNIRLGKEPTKSIANINKIYEKDGDEFKDFVDKFEDNKDYTVTLPVPPFTHSFYISLLEPGKIMVADIGGQENLRKGLLNYSTQRGRTVNNNKKNYDPKYTNYSNFFEKLKDKYPSKTIEYYPLDDELNQKARSNPIYLKYKTGACAEYLYDWLKEHVN